MGVNFRLETCGWVIILIHKTSGLVTISILLPGNGWFSCKLNKTYCNLTNIGPCFVIHSLGMALLLLIDGPPFVSEWVNFPIVWPPPPPRQNEVQAGLVARICEQVLQKSPRLRNHL